MKTQMKKENGGYNHQSIEKSMLEYWQKNKCFEKLVEKNKNGERFRFLDGPITANNPMGVHHAFGRTLKDITVKYNAMTGKSCQYQNGFDAQGLWVEVEVEKALGFKNKKDIYNFGLDNFTNACMDRVKKMSGIITEQSKQLGQWMDWEHSYYTNSDENILSIWHFLKVCNEKEMLEKKYRAMPWCPRCGTSLSEHEMSGCYHEVECDAVFFKLPLKNSNEKILVWTTTPWTLCANVAVAVNPAIKYSYVKTKETGETIICASSLVKKIIKGDFDKIEKEVVGEDLIGLEYETCFNKLEIQNFVHKIIPWDDVVETEGTGLVHIAPGCGAEDFELGLKYNLKQICPIDENGIITKEFGVLKDKSTVEVAPLVFEELKKVNKLYYSHKYKHSYPSCWRCKTDVVFKLVSEWSLKSSVIRNQLIECANQVEWQPAYTQKRMVDWLNNMGDWNISRKRFYGLPLPFYVCPKCGKVEVIGSLEELKQKAVNPSLVDKLPHLHRPWIDEIKIKCSCGEEVSRIPEVGDCWLDAGITPFSTKKYFTDKDYFNKNYPNQIVIEMVEQIRLWFYSLLYMSVVLEGKAPYEKVVTYGSVVQENGEKFSKSSISIKLEDGIQKIGADSIRYLYAGSNQTNDLRFGFNLGEEATRKMMGLWNAYIFFNLYAVLDKPELDGYTPNPETLDITSKWLLQSTNDFIRNSKKSYEENSYQGVIKCFEEFTDNLSNWYIRINRKVFWKEKGETQKNAYYVLYTAIKTLCQVMAPIIPFLTDYIWQNMVRVIEPNEAESVHLSTFPDSVCDADYSLVVEQTQKVRDVIYLAQKLRNEHKIKVKQPLREMFLVVENDYEEAVKNYENIIKEEINVKNIDIEVDRERFNYHKLAVNFKEAGKVLKQNVNKLKNTLESLSQDEINHQINFMKENGYITLEGFEEKLDAGLFIINTVPKDEYAIANLGNNLVILDIEIDEQLEKEGSLRSLIRRLQMMRKEANCNVEDRINLEIQSDDKEILELIEQNQQQIKESVLINNIGKVENPTYQADLDLDDIVLKIKLCVK